MNQPAASTTGTGSSSSFNVRTARYGDDAVIHVAGELDLNSCSELDDAIRDAEVSAVGLVVIDLTGLAFLDSTGLSLLLEARKRSNQNGGRLRFLPSQQSQVTRLLEITDTEELLD